MLHGELARQIRPDCSEDVVFLTTWRDLGALYAWIGRDDLLASPLLREDDESLFLSLEVQHYEALDEPEVEPAVDFLLSSESAQH